MSFPPPDTASLDARFPPLHFGFDLREDPGFEPPAGVAALRGKDQVRLRVAVGAHYFFTCLVAREPDFAVVTEFMNSTLDTDHLHRFIGENFSLDKEWNRETSSRYAKLIGIAFMAEHAGSTWFAPIADLKPTGGTLSFRKLEQKRHGPDYLAAPFDPTVSGTPDPFYALEFKGRKQRVTFDSPSFQEWRAQATNIDCIDDTGVHRSIKSWILAFNYAFKHGSGHRDCSTLLVDDPSAGEPNTPPIESTRARESIAPIIRAHLARQCRKLGAGVLSNAVLTGRLLERRSTFPSTYLIEHPRLRDRRYIGWFGSWGPQGEIIWSSAPEMDFGRWAIDILDFEVRPDSPGFYVRAWIRGQGRGESRVEVLVHGAGTWPGSHRDVEHWLQRTLGGGGGAKFFVGQDATMVRECLHTHRGEALRGLPFTDPIVVGQGDQDGDLPGAIRVIRNGSVVASSIAVQPTDDDLDWWTKPNTQ